MTNLPAPISLHQAARYRITLQGRLDPKWSDFFGGMAISTDTAIWGFSVTILEGIVVDQSALHGMLNHVRDLGLPLLSVECLSADEP